MQRTVARKVPIQKVCEQGEELLFAQVLALIEVQVLSILPHLHVFLSVIFVEFQGVVRGEFVVAQGVRVFRMKGGENALEFVFLENHLEVLEELLRRLEEDELFVELALGGEEKLNHHREHSFAVIFIHLHCQVVRGEHKALSHQILVPLITRPIVDKF